MYRIAEDSLEETYAHSHPVSRHRNVFASAFGPKSGNRTAPSRPALPPRILPLLSKFHAESSDSSTSGHIKIIREDKNVKKAEESVVTVFDSTESCSTDVLSPSNPASDGDLAFTNNSNEEPPSLSSSNEKSTLPIGTLVKEQNLTQENNSKSVNQETMVLQEVVCPVTVPSEEIKSKSWELKNATCKKDHNNTKQHISAAAERNVPQKTMHQENKSVATPYSLKSIKPSVTPFSHKEEMPSVTPYLQVREVSRTQQQRSSVTPASWSSSQAILSLRSKPHETNEQTPSTVQVQSMSCKQDRFKSRPFQETSSPCEAGKTIPQCVGQSNDTKQIILPKTASRVQAIITNTNDSKENGLAYQVREASKPKFSTDTKKASRVSFLEMPNRDNTGSSQLTTVSVKRTLFIDPDIQQREAKDELLKPLHSEVEVSGSCLSFPQPVAKPVLTVKNTKYTVLSKLGAGGSSQVFQVLEPFTSELLAVKCVNLAGAETVTANSYLNEIELLSKLQTSSKVIRLIDHEYVEEEKMLYVVMEKGDIDLSTLLKTMWKAEEVISMPMIIYYWTEMLSVVKDIHDHGIVHADLKPANFLLVCGRLKLIDFGIASSVQNDMTSIQKTGMFGTFNYMSPEAIQDPMDKNKSKVGFKSDVWSLGCILYNMLYGKTPFQDYSNSLMKLTAIANPKHTIRYPPVEKCPPVLMQALRRCLTYNSKLRPSVYDLLNLHYIATGSPEKSGHSP